MMYACSRALPGMGLKVAAMEIMFLFISSPALFCFPHLLFPEGIPSKNHVHMICASGSVSREHDSRIVPQLVLVAKRDSDLKYYYRVKIKVRNEDQLMFWF